MDPLSALACLASAAAEASPTDAADTSVSSMISATEPFYPTQTSMSPPSSGSQNGGHHIFSYSSQYFQPHNRQPAVVHSRPTGNVNGVVHSSLHYSNGGGFRGQQRGSGLCYGRVDEEVREEKRPSLANYMASLGKGPLPKPRKQRPKRSASLNNHSGSSNHSSDNNSSRSASPVVSNSRSSSPVPRTVRTQSPSLVPSQQLNEDVAMSDAYESDDGGHPDRRRQRKSAKAARNYLQRVMHNQFGDVQGKTQTIAGNGTAGPASTAVMNGTANPDASVLTNGSKKRSSSPVPSDSSSAKRRKESNKNKGSGAESKKQASSGARVVSNESSTASNSNKSSPIAATKDAEEDNNNDAEMVTDDETSESESESSESEEEESDEEPEPEPIFREVKAEDLAEDKRVLIAYRNSLYKATIRKVRTRDEKEADYLIHYDGNKKSNVHWVPLGQMQALLDDSDQPFTVPPPPREEKPKKEKKQKKKKKKKKQKKKKRPSKMAEEGESDGGDAVLEGDGGSDEDWEFPRGKDVYVTYEDLLYRCTVLNRRMKKGSHEYFVYWDGFKKTHNSWVKEANVEKITAYSSRRFNKQSVEDESEEEEEEWEYPIGKDVYIEYDDFLYRATVLNRRLRKGSYQYLVHYDGFKKASDGWVKDEDVHKITAYTSRRFNKQSAANEEEKEEVVEEEEEEEPQEEEEQAVEEEDEEYPTGTVVYVEYNDVLYRATVLNRRTRKGDFEYLVHYDGYKKTADRWVKYEEIQKRTAYTSRRYNKERREEANQKSDRSTASASSKSKGPAPSEAEPDASEEEDQTLDMSGIQSGVEFLPGSSVFVKWKEALYLAKMMKRRLRAGKTQYFINYNGFRDSSNAWVDLDDIYEINPRTRKIFEKKDTKQVRTKTSSDHLNRVTVNNKKRQYNKQSSVGSTGTSSGLDALEDVDSGVTFMAGSTLFAKIGEALHLAKMVKRSGQKEHTEYFVSYVHQKKTHEVWVPISKVFEINAQTKRIYNKNK